MATVHNARDIYFEHELALYEEDLELKQDENLDWEALDNVADAMTSMVYKDINDKFKKSFFGKFIKPHYFEKTIDGKSPFEYHVYAYSFCVVTSLKIKDIDFTLPNNPFSDIIAELSEFTDLKEFSLVLEFNTKNSDFSYIADYEIRADVGRSYHTRDRFSENIMDFTNLTQLNNAINKNSYPDYCNTLRKKIIYSIFELDYICHLYNIDLEYLVHHYDEAHAIIQNYALVHDMETV